MPSTPSTSAPGSNRHRRILPKTSWPFGKHPAHDAAPR